MHQKFSTVRSVCLSHRLRRRLPPSTLRDVWGRQGKRAFCTGSRPANFSKSGTRRSLAVTLSRRWMPQRGHTASPRASSWETCSKHSPVVTETCWRIVPRRPREQMLLRLEIEQDHHNHKAKVISHSSSKIDQARKNNDTSGPMDVAK